MPSVNMLGFIQESSLYVVIIVQPITPILFKYNFIMLSLNVACSAGKATAALANSDSAKPLQAGIRLQPAENRLTAGLGFHV